MLISMLKYIKIFEGIFMYFNIEINILE